jgi:hypothetical protein
MTRRLGTATSLGATSTHRMTHHLQPVREHLGEVLNGLRREVRILQLRYGLLTAPTLGVAASGGRAARRQIERRH